MIPCLTYKLLNPSGIASAISTEKYEWIVIHSKVKPKDVSSQPLHRKDALPIVYQTWYKPKELDIK